MNKLVIFGDSISTNLIGHGGYETPLKGLLGISNVVNCAVACSGAALCTPDSLVSVIDGCDLKQHSDAEAVILWHGTNDWYWGSPIGTLGSSDKHTFLGAMEYAVTRIKESLPKAKIVMATPLLRLEAPHGSDVMIEGHCNRSKVGFTLLDYSKAVLKLEEHLGICVVDMRRLTKFNRQNMNRYLPDGVHPSKQGCTRIAEIFAQYISKFMNGDNE